MMVATGFTPEIFWSMVPANPKHGAQKHCAPRPSMVLPEPKHGASNPKHGASVNLKMTIDFIV